MRINLRDLRVNEGLTQVQLAELVEVSRQTIISIESGRFTPSVLLALKLARVFKISVEEIFLLESDD